MSRRLRNCLLVAGILLIALFASACAGQQSPAMVRSEDSGGFATAGGADAFYAEEAAEAPMPMEEPAMEGEIGMDFDDVESSALGDSTNVASDGQAVQIERLIIRNGSITVSVENTRDAKAEIEQLVASMAGNGAFVVSSNESGGSSGSPYINMTIRVPAENFDSVMDTLEGLAAEGTNPSLNESAQDVTEEYVDISARLESLEAARERLLQLMEQAETTEALLQAESQLTQREAEIEALKGRLRYLEESAGLSRIDISLQPYILSQPVDTRWRPLETLRESLDDLLDGMRGFADILIRFIVVILPFLLIIGAIIYGIVRFVIWRIRIGQRKRAERQAQQSVESEE